MNVLSVEEVQEKYFNVVKKLNQKGLERMVLLLDIMNDVVIYNKNTIPEIIEEKKEPIESKEQIQIEMEKAMHEQALANYKRTNDLIASLSGKDKKLFNNLNKLSNDKEVDRHSMTLHELMLFRNIYDNNLVNGSENIYRYGYMKGLAASKEK